MTDPTNVETSYERNRLRHEVLPGLTDDGARLSPMLATLENLASEREALETIAAQYLDEALLRPPDPESVALDAAPLRNAPRAVAMLALQRAVTVLPAEVALAREHLQVAIEAIAAGSTAEIAVRGAVVHVERGFVLVEVARGRGGKHLFEREAHSITIADTVRDGQVPWFGSTLRWETNNDVEGLQVRGPRPGDRLDAHGLDGHKRVVDVFKEAGVPSSIRWRWPCVVHNQKVEWICGLRQATRGGATPLDAPSDARSICLIWQPEPGSIFARVVGRTTNRFDLQYF